MISKNKIFLLLFCLFFLFANFCFVNATNGIPRNDPSEVKFAPQIGIPGSEFEAGKEVAVSGKTFIEYLKAIYVWSVRAIAVIAIIMIMIAGFQWMTAAGNASAIGQAKSRISSSLIGLLLAIGAYSLLNFVNPSLVHLRTLDLGDNIEYVPLNTYNKLCTSDGYIMYWYDYWHCFDLYEDDKPKDDMEIGVGLGEVIQKQDIQKIQIRLGVGENHAEGKKILFLLII